MRGVRGRSAKAAPGNRIPGALARHVVPHCERIRVPTVHDADMHEKPFSHTLRTHTPSPPFSPPPLNVSTQVPDRLRLSTTTTCACASSPCPYLPSAACPATLANRTSAPFSILTYSNPHHPIRVQLMLPLPLTPTFVEDLRSLLGVRTGDRVRRLVTRTRTRERSEEASRPRAHQPLPPDMTMVPVPSFPTLPTVLGASPVSLTAISTGGERPPPQSVAASLHTAANPPSQCLLSHHPPTFLLPLVHGLHASTTQVAVPPLPVTNG
jgi:hypothetical protein